MLDYKLLPAFPQAHDDSGYAGMHLRDYFAAHAPEPPTTWHAGDKKVKDIIEWRWAYADAMLKERIK